MSRCDGAARVVHVSSAHRWTDNRIHFREAASLAAHGYDVHLVAVEHNLEAPATGVRVVRLPARPRLQRFTLGTVAAILTALRTRADIFHLHDPELVWAVPVLRALGKKVVYDAHEDLPAQTMHKTYLPLWARHAVSALSHVVVLVASGSHRVVCATEAIARRFPAHKVAIVHNYPRLTVTPDPTPLAARPTSVIYVGAISAERGIQVMVEALAQPEFPQEWSGVLVGESPPDLLALMRRAPGWSRVDYRGVLAPDAAQNAMRGSRIGLVLSQRNPAYLESLPTKMFEYFAAGIPVIASRFPLWEEIVVRHECGILVDETDPRAVASAVAQYAADPELLATHGRNAQRLFAERLNWAAEERTLLSVYEALTRHVPVVR